MHPNKTLTAICIATYKRRRLLEGLLESLKKIDLPENTDVELRIIDNDKAESAREMCDALQMASLPFSKVHYKVETDQNIASARNAGLEIGYADYIVFVDDDEWVCQTWLNDLATARDKHDADAVFGPVIGRCPKASPEWMERGNFYNKNVPPTGQEVNWKETRTSNTYVSGKWFYGNNKIRFDQALGRSGGSDSDLFSKIAQAGGKFIACQEAVVYEDVPAKRATFKWLWSRWYRNGLIYERITRRLPNELGSFARFVRRIGAMLLLSLKGIPNFLRGQPEDTIKGLLKIPLALGGLKAALAPESTTKHVAYKNPDTTKVAFLTNIISPYRLPVFERLSKTSAWDFEVYADASNEFDRKWDVKSKSLKISYPKSIHFKRKVISHEPIKFEQVITLHFPIGLLISLFTKRPDTVISLELGFRTALASIYCSLAKKTLIIWAYQSKISGTQGKSRNRWRRFLLSRAKCVVGMGAQARQVLKGWGVPDSKIVDAFNAADHVSLKETLSLPSAEEKIRAIKDKYSERPKTAVVIGRLIPLKGIEHLLKAWGDLPESTKNTWQLLFIGNGPMDEMIKASSDPSVNLVGFIEINEIAHWYAAADLHIFPTCGDVWGLVVNEASLCKTPSLCSIYAGCYDDLIEDGVNGLSIDFLDSQNATSVLDNALNRADLPELGAAAYEHIQTFTLDNLAGSFRRAVAVATANENTLASNSLTTNESGKN